MAPHKLEGFSGSDYRQLLLALQELGYRDVALAELDPDEQQMFVRHDVDLSLEHAFRLGKVEQELGVHSTFYVLLSTEIYNLSSAQSRRLLAGLIAQGHTVGLHFDVTVYHDEDRAELENRAADECHILEQLTGHPVSSISFHRPMKEFLNLPGNFAGRRHTYEPQFFSAVGYVSDSNGGWRHGHPLDHPAVVGRRGLQLLTHPIWWMQTEPLGPVEVMERLRRERMDADLAAMAGTVTVYKDWLATGQSK